MTPSCHDCLNQYLSKVTFELHSCIITILVVAPYSKHTRAYTSHSIAWIKRMLPGISMITDQSLPLPW